MNRLLSIQALRGVAVLGVVGFHALTIEHKYSGGDLLLPAFLSLGQAGVDLFFVISGFVMVTVTRDRFGQPGEKMRFLWGRLSRIYPVYWFYFFLTLAIFLIKPAWVNSSQGHQARLLASFLLWPTDQLPLVMVAWSLIHELWFYLVFALLLFFPQRFLLPALLIWGAAVAGVNQVIDLAALAPGWRLVLHPFSLEFIIGALAALFVFGSETPRLAPGPAALLLLLVVLVGPPAVDGFQVLQLPPGPRAQIVGPLCGLLVLAVVTLEQHDKIPVPSLLRNVGDISYTVYLSHILVLSAIGRLWQLAPSAPRSLADNVLACLLMLAAVLGYGWAGYRLIEQPLVHISHRLRARWFDPGRRPAPAPAADPEIAS